MNPRNLELDVREILEHYGKGRAEEGLNRSKIAYKRAPHLAITNYCIGHGLAATRKTSAALPFLQKAVELAPKNADYLLRLGLTQLESGDFKTAATTLEKVHEINPKLVNGKWALGAFYASIDRFDKAANMFKDVIDSGLPESLLASARLDWSRALIANGKADEARTVLNGLLAHPSLRTKALMRLAEIEPFPLESPEFAEIEKELQSSRPEGFPLSLLLVAKASCFGAAKNYEQEYELLGESKIARGSDFKPQQFEERVSITIRMFEDGAFERTRRLFGDSTFKPIFIVGVPRSGTTLTERILSRHTDVGAAGELQLVSTFLFKCLGDNPPERMTNVMESIGASSIQQLAKSIEETMRFLCPEKDRIIDKLPGNYLNIGWICSLFPHAKIIHCYRDPADNMLSGFKAALGSGHAYFDRSDWFIPFYRQYARLMKFWQSLLPGRIHSLCYEDLVAHPEQSIRSLLEYCDLEWQEECLYPERNAARILTASLMQARSPINAGSVGGWRRYAKHLHVVHEQLTGVWDQTDKQ